MIDDLDRLRDSIFSRAAIVVAEAGAHVADPRSDDALHTTGANELVEQDVGDRADERQAAPALADDLVTGCKRDERFEREPHRYRVAVADETRDGLAHRTDFARGHFNQRRASLGLLRRTLCHSPVNLAIFLSTYELRPSFASLLWKSSCCSSRSMASASENGTSAPDCTARLMLPTAFAALFGVVNCFAYVMTSLMNSSPDLTS